MSFNTGNFLYFPKKEEEIDLFLVNTYCECRALCDPIFLKEISY